MSAGSVIRRKAEKAFQRMVKEEKTKNQEASFSPGKGYVYSPHDSIFASSAKNFVLSIPLKAQEKPVAVSTEFKRSAKEEYICRYLEQIGASPNDENVAMVEKHMGIEDNCNVTAVWKSRGVVADYLHVAPNWANPNSRDPRAVNSSEVQTKRSKPPRDSDKLFADFNIVQSSLKQIEVKRKDKEFKPIEHKEPERFSNKSAEQVFAMLRAKNEDELDDDVQSDNEYDENGGTGPLMLRFVDLVDMLEDLTNVSKLYLSKRKRVASRLSNAKRKLLTEKKKRKRYEEKKKEGKHLFNKRFEVFPQRVFVSASNDLQQPAKPRVLSLLVKQSIETELSVPMHALVIIKRQTIIQTSTRLLKSYTSYKASSEKVKLLLTHPLVVELVCVTARYIFKKCIVDEIIRVGVRWPVQKEIQEEPTQTYRKGGIHPRPGVNRGERRTVSRNTHLDKVLPPELFEDKSTKELMELASNTFSELKELYMNVNPHAVREELPAVVVLVRCCVDALVNSYYRKTVASLSYVLEKEQEEYLLSLETLGSQTPQNRKDKKMKKLTRLSAACFVRLEYDNCICDLIDPGGFLRGTNNFTPTKTNSNRPSRKQRAKYSNQTSPRSTGQYCTTTKAIASKTSYGTIRLQAGLSTCTFSKNLVQKNKS